MRKSCSAFVGKQDILVAAAALTTHGFEIHSEPIYKLAEDQSDGAVGRAVLKALGSYQVGVQPPGPDMNSKPSPLLQEAGSRSWGQFYRARHTVLVGLEAGEVAALPTRRSVDGSLDPLNDLAVRCGTIEEDVGAAVCKAALLCS